MKKTRPNRADTTAMHGHKPGVVKRPQNTKTTATWPKRARRNTYLNAKILKMLTWSLPT